MNEKSWLDLKILAFIEFFDSLINYLRLYREGMKITRSVPFYGGTFRIFRFWWKGHLMDDFPDIDIADEHYVTTMMNGSSKLLPGGKKSVGHK